MLLFLFIYDTEDLNLVMLIFSIGYIINAIIAWFIISLHHKISLRRVSIKEMKNSFIRGKDILISNLVVQVYSNIVIIFSSGLLTPRDIGVLGVYLKIRDIGQSIIGPIQQAIFPTISKFVFEIKIQKLKKLVSNTILILFGIMILYFLALLTMFDQINKYMFDGQTSYNELFWFGLILCFIFYGGVFTKVMVAFNKMKWVLNSTLFSGLVSLSISYFFMDNYGLVGAIWVIGIGYFFNSFIGYYYYSKLTKNN